MKIYISLFVFILMFSLISANDFYISTSSNGTFQKINTTKLIVPISYTIGSQNYDLTLDTKKYQVYFKSKSSQNSQDLKNIAIVQDDYILMLTPEAVDPYIIFDTDCDTAASNRVGSKQISIATLSNNQITYPAAFKQFGGSTSFADLRYTANNNLVKEDLIINSNDFIKTRYNLCYNTNKSVNLVHNTDIKAFYKNDIDINSLSISYGRLNLINFKSFGVFNNLSSTTSDEIYFKGVNNKTIYYIPKLYATDSINNKILLNKTLTMTQSGNLRVSVLTPYSWLINSSIVYPIFIDPSIVSALESRVQYDNDGYSISVTLKKLVNNSYEISPNDIFINNSNFSKLKFGAIDYNPINTNDGEINLYMYEWNSSNEIKKDSLGYYIEGSYSIFEKIGMFFGILKTRMTYIDVRDICSYSISNCVFNLNNDSKILNLTFNAPTYNNQVFIDPSFTEVYVSSGLSQLFQPSKVEGTALGVRLQASSLFMDFNSAPSGDSNTYVTDNSVYNNAGTLQ